MTAVVRAELRRLCRTRPLVLAAAGGLVFAVVSTVAVLTGAPETGPTGPQGGTTLERLAQEGGGTEAFATGASFSGFFVFVTFIALLASELSGGTFRAVLLRNPRRLQVLVGKVVGILLVAAGVTAFAELCSFLVALAVAPGQGLSTSAWLTAGSARLALGDFATVLAGVTGWAVLGTTLAVVFRSAPLALGVGFAWAGPFENIVSDSWSTGLRIFPGQVLRAVMNSGTPELGFGRALGTALLYTGAAAGLSMWLLARRDVTA